MIETVMKRYPAEYWPREVRRLGNAGGFSGAMIWQLETAQATMCLRRWPRACPTPERLFGIHQVLKHVGARCNFVPVPIDVASREAAPESFVHYDGHLWELTVWLPGTAELDSNVTEQLVAAAMRALAEFHVAAAELGVSQLKSDGLQERHRMACEFAAGRLEKWRQALATYSGEHEHLERCRQIVTLCRPLVERLPAMLSSVAEHPLEIQHCLRDVKRDHLLFEGTNVTGLIDYGAMRRDSVSGDIARLLGSLGDVGTKMWRHGLSAYEEMRTLSVHEKTAIPLFHNANVALSGLNWVRWLMFERKTFEDTSEVGARLDEIMECLRGHSGTGS